MTSTAWLWSSRTGRQAQPGIPWSSEVLETLSTRTESSARFLCFLFVLLDDDYCIILISSGYRRATCLETAQVPVCWKERQIDESWKHQLVILVRQLTAPEAVLCEICVKLEVVISQCHNKWSFVNVKSFPFILPLGFSEFWSLGINPFTMEDMVGKWKLEKRDPNFEEFLICRQVNGTLRDHLTLDSWLQRLGGFWGSWWPAPLWTQNTS